MKHDRSHHCAGFRHTNECSGSFQYTGDKTDKPVGIGRMGTVHSASGLYWGMVFTGRQEVTALFQVTPRYVLLGGVIGAAITITVIQSMNSLGPAQSAMLIVIAQLIAAWLIELFGWFGMEKTSFEWRKFIGMLVAIAGIILFKWEK